jgi:hypothetical protein
MIFRWAFFLGEKMASYPLTLALSLRERELTWRQSGSLVPVGKDFGCGSFVVPALQAVNRH